MVQINEYAYAREVVANKSEQMTISSLEVAEMVGRRHDQVLRDIQKVTEQLTKNNDHKSVAVEKYFIASTYTDKKGETRPAFQLTKKGCELYATRMTGAKGTLFAAAYIDRFHEMEEALRPRVLSEKEQLIASMELTIETSKKMLLIERNMNRQEKDIKMLKTDMRIDGHQERRLQERGARKVVEALGGKHSRAYETLSRKAFSTFWGGFKRYFAIPRYGDLPKVKFDEAMHYINKWRPDTELAIAIDYENKKTTLDVNDGTVTTRGGNQ